jgi:hypothetical protein
MRTLASLTLFALSAILAFTQGIAPSFACLVLGSAALIERPAGTPIGSLFAVTLTPTVLLQQTMRKLFVKVPMLMFFASEFTTERVKRNQQVIGKIRLRPTASEYDTTYKTGAQETRDLLLDVPFTMDKHIHVTLKLSHLYAIQDKMNKLEEHIEDSASVIGKAMAQYALGKIGSLIFSNASIFTAANSDKDALNDIRKKLNLRGVPDNRFGIVNSDVAETLEGDARITNRYDNRSQNTDDSGLLHLRNVSGFKDIVEFPELDDKTDAALNITGEADTDLITTGAAHDFVVNERVQIPTVTGGTGITALDYAFVKTAPSSTTLTLSATRGGATLNFTTDITAGTIKRAENMSGFFGTREAIAFKTGLPIDGIEAAQAFGIPVPVSSEVVTDPDSGLSMIAYKWFEPGSMDAYVTLALLYGATAGALVDTDGHVMEPAGHILRTE